MNEEKDNIVAEGDLSAADEKFLRDKKKQPGGAKRHGYYDFGRLLAGLFVVFIGSLLLAKGAGILPESFSIEIFRFWPLLIVAFGLSLIDARSRLGSIIGFIILLVIILIFAIFLRDSVRNDKSPRLRNLPGSITEDSVAPKYHLYSDWSEAR